MTSNTIMAFIHKEFSQTLRDIRMRMILFVMPLVQMTIFGLAISTEIKGIRLAVFHAPSDSQASKLAEHFYASGWFIPVPVILPPLIPPPMRGRGGWGGFS